MSEVVDCVALATGIVAINQSQASTEEKQARQMVDPKNRDCCLLVGVEFLAIGKSARIIVQVTNNSS